MIIYSIFNDRDGIVIMLRYTMNDRCPGKRCMCIVMAITCVIHLVLVLVYIHESNNRPMAPSIPKGFYPRLKSAEKEILMSLIDAFDGAMVQAGIPYFMYGGTLIGSYRHHGQIPWDDDADFAVPTVLRKNASRALRALEPNIVLSEKQGTRWKLFSTKGNTIRALAWRFPFLDVNFYYQNSTHIWDYDLKNYKKFIFPVDMIFPLVTRPFEGRNLPSPRAAKAVIDQNYNMTECKTGAWSHSMEKPILSIHSAACSDLFSVHPFVKRVPGSSEGCNETLVLNGEVISWILMKNDTC